MTQEELAVAGGVKRLTQIKYEKNASAPDTDYLSGVAAVGIDIIFLLEGRRLPSVEHHEWADQLSAEQVRMIEVRVFELTEIVARRQHDKKLSSDARHALHHVLVRFLAQQKLGLIPADFDVMRLLEGV